MIGNETMGNPSQDFGITSDKGFIGMWSGLSGTGDQSLLSVKSINDSKWHYVAAVNDGSKIVLYVDGSLIQGSISSGLALKTTSFPLRIGSSNSVNIPHLNHQGTYDEVRIWNVVRTQEEIQNDMHSIGRKDTTGLVAYYPFNQGIAGGTNTNIVTADEVTSNNNDGALNKFALTGHKSNWVEGVPGVDLQDSLALVDFYNNTGGTNWVNHQNWLTKNRLSTWYGITVSGINVTAITLSNNQLSGHIPAALRRLGSLQYLSLDSNQLDGPIPPSLGNLTNLQYLYLRSNQLTGPIPASFGDLTNLVDLDLRLNNLRDTIPASLGNCTDLRYIQLTHNRLTGNIPSTFSNLEKLIKLNVGDNRLSGTVPSFLGTFPRLKRLNILHNHYTFNGLETLVQHDFDTLRYYNQRYINLHQNGNTLSVYAGGTLSNNTYTWYRDGALAATITGDSTFTATASGNYNVEVTNAIATALTLKSDTLFYSGHGLIGDNLIAQSNTTFSVYPNPAKTTVTVTFNAMGNCTLKLTDVSGTVLQTRTVMAVKGANIIQLDVSRYATGVYFVTLINELKQTQTIQLNKQ
jgi:hypothetical protein